MQTGPTAEFTVADAHSEIGGLLVTGRLAHGTVRAGDRLTVDSPAATAAPAPELTVLGVEFLRTCFGPAEESGRQVALMLAEPTGTALSAGARLLAVADTGPPCPVPVQGLDADGHLAREGSPDLVQPEYADVPAAARELIAAAFPPDRLHSAYLYGSIPRGTAVPGVSDLDLLLALHHEPTAADRSAADRLALDLDSALPQVEGVGILLHSTATLLSDLERHDLGWFLACLCTPLLGPDLAAGLPRYRPTALLARETNGDLALALPRWHERAAAADTDRKALTRAVARRLVRTGLTLVMPRWGGWTSDLATSAAVFGHYYPQRARQMARAATLARTPTTNPTALPLLLDLATWLATEYLTVHGPKTPRP